MFEENENDINQNLNTEFYKKLNQQIVQKDKLIKMLQKHIEKLKDGVSIDSDNADTNEQEQQINDLRRENEDLKARLESFEIKAQDYEELKAEYSSLKEKVNTISDEEDIRKIEFLTSQLTEKDSEINAFIEKVEKLESRINELKNELMEAQNRINVSETLKSQNEELQSDVRELQNRIQLMETELGSNDRKIKELTEALDKSRELSEKEGQGEIAEYQSRISMLESEMEAFISENNVERENSRKYVDTLQNQLNEVVKERSLLEQRFNSMKEELEEKSLLLEEQNGQASEGNVELASKVKKLESELSSERLIIAQLQQDKEAMSLQIDKLKLVKSEPRISALNSSDKDEAIEQMKSRIGQLNNELSASLAREKKLEAEVKILEDRVKKPAILDGEQLSVEGWDYNAHGIIGYIDAQEKEWGDRDREIAWSLLKEFGIKVIETVGSKYDPVLHQIVGTVKNDSFPEETVISESQSGFIANDDVLRKASVIIVKNTLECTACSKILKTEDRFCSGCGARVDILFNSAGEEEELEKAAMIFCRIAENHFHAEDFTGALARLEESLKIDPNNEESLKLKGEVYSKLGNFENAIECFERAFEINPDFRNENKLKGLRAKLAILNSIKDIEL